MADSGAGSRPPAASNLARRTRSLARLKTQALWRRTGAVIGDRWYRIRFRKSVLELPTGARLGLPYIDLPPLDELPEPLREPGREILAEADQVLLHRLRFVSDRTHDYGRPLDWKTDPETGRAWPEHFHKDIEVVDLLDASDPIRVWELSRGHHLLTLARASRLAPDRADLYLAELADQLEGWLTANPTGYGVNWFNAMEAAIRATNWIWALATAGPERLPPKTIARATVSLQQHGRFIRKNLEGNRLRRGNHFLADLMGLAAIGQVIEGDTTLRRSAAFAARRLPRELERQVAEDGGNFEDSGPYQGLVLEMLSVTALCLKRQGRPIPESSRDRLEKMVDFTVALRHPDGRIPQYGDSDSGRILPAGFSRPPKHDAAIWMAAAVLGLARPLPGDPDPEVAWNLGLGAWEALTNQAEPIRRPPSGLPNTGIYVLEGGGSKVVVQCSPIDRDGVGVHAHSDALSFEMSVHGAPLIVDPGTLSYTGDLEGRNEMRSTSVHSTPQVDGQEIDRFRHEWIFRIDEVSPPFVAAFEESAELTTLECGHDSFRRLPDPVRVRRRFRLDRVSGSLEISDRFEGSGRHRITMPLPLLPGLEVLHADGDGALIGFSGNKTEVTVEGTSLSVGSYLYSSGYGLGEEARRLMTAWEGDLPHEVIVRITPQPRPLPDPNAAKRPPAS